MSDIVPTGKVSQDSVNHRVSKYPFSWLITIPLVSREDQEFLVLLHSHLISCYLAYSHRINETIDLLINLIRPEFDLILSLISYNA